MNVIGQTALITGASRGIGKEIAIELSKQGINVAITYINNRENAEEVVKQIKQNGVNGMAVKADISKENDVDNMIRTVNKEMGAIDVLVNNAGITKDNLFIRMKTEEWDDVIETNLRGTYLCTKYVIREMMKKRRGKIINIASVVGIIGNSGQGNYSASKAGIIGLTKSLAKELASRNINVNAVAPGFIETDMTGVLKQDIKDSLVKSIPMKRIGTPKDIANIVVFLASEESDYITGQVINVDGGMVM